MQQTDHVTTRTSMGVFKLRYHFSNTASKAELPSDLRTQGVSITHPAYKLQLPNCGSRNFRSKKFVDASRQAFLTRNLNYDIQQVPKDDTVRVFQYFELMMWKNLGKVGSVLWKAGSSWACLLFFPSSGWVSRHKDSSGFFIELIIDWPNTAKMTNQTPPM